VRNLGLIVAFWLTALLPINSFALGLGEIEVNSFLNQPLSAEIEVLSARPGEIDDLLVSLASRDAFTRAGLERPRHLSELRFEVKKNEAGDSAVILVTTRAAVKEPFLNFLVEADWSQGRLLREFTILLDPPFYADQPAPVEQGPPTKTVHLCFFALEKQMSRLATALSAGFLLGLVEAFGMHFTNPSLKMVLSYGVLVAVLVARPKGLFAR